MKFALLIAPLAVIAIGTLAPRLFSSPTNSSNLGMLGNDAEGIVIREMAHRLKSTANSSAMTLSWSEDNGAFQLQCHACYEPAKKRLVSYTDHNKIEFSPVTPQVLLRMASLQDGTSFANARKLSLKQ